MINGDFFEVEPWSLTENELHQDHLSTTESLFALSNGHVGLRGNLDEGQPNGTPGTYLNGFFESRPLPYAEAGTAPGGGPDPHRRHQRQAHPVARRRRAARRPPRVVEHHCRSLDFRTGLLDRDLEWRSPAGKVVRVRSKRLVSFVHRAVAAVRYEVTAVDEPLRIVVQSTLVANESTDVENGDPRAAAALRAPLVGEFHTAQGLEAALGHHTCASGLGWQRASPTPSTGPRARSPTPRARPIWPVSR